MAIRLSVVYPLPIGLSVVCLILVACGSSTPLRDGGIDVTPIPNATMVYYNVQGATEAELRSSLDALRPNAEDAYTAWRITWTWPQDGTGICHLADVTVSYLVTVTFPRWQPPETAPSTLIEKWVSYTRALADHEKGHVDFVVANVPVLIDSIHRATCDTANLAAEAILDRIREDDLDYDLHTDHGATQGARFP